MHAVFMASVIERM